MITAGPRPPLRHRAVVERNAETGLSPTRQPLPPRYESLHAALPCHFWEVEEVPGRSSAGLREGPNVDLIVHGLRMLVAKDADVEVGDKILSVVEAQSGAVITDNPMRIVKNLWRSTHREIGMEQAHGDATESVGES